jgi:transposase-like protein
MALAMLAQEAFINGVSTLRMQRLAQALSIENVSASQDSEMNQELDGQVEDRVMTLSLMIAQGVNGKGTREILAVEPMFDESEDSLRAFFQKLKKRGLLRIHLCIPDVDVGIQAAVKKELLSACWQRCNVRFMRDILVNVPYKEKRRFAAHLKQIWLQPDKNIAQCAATQPVQEYSERFPRPRAVSRKGLRTRLSATLSPKSTPRGSPGRNMSERTIREVRRRSRMVGIYPSIASWVRLGTSSFMEYSEDWPTDRSYIKREKVKEATERGCAFVPAQAAS